MIDIDAQTHLGAQLLTGKGAPFSPHEGIRTLMRASDHGGAEAAAILATLTGMGAGLPQNWSEALDLLTLAATRGSERARGQLRVLAGESDPGADDWSALARRIDIEAWTTPPLKSAICEAPRIRMLEGFINPQTCDWLIGIGHGRVAPALVYDPDTGAPLMADARDNTALEFSIVDLDLVAVLVRARISAAVNVPVGAFEPPQIMHYDVGQKFEPHYDFLDAAEPAYARDVASRGQRIITFLIYLNDSYEGGATAFPKAGLNVKGKPGDAVMFANVDLAGEPDRMTLHAGTPPTSGEKWLFSQWIRDRIAPAAH